MLSRQSQKCRSHEIAQKCDQCTWITELRYFSVKGQHFCKRTISVMIWLVLHHCKVKTNVVLHQLNDLHLSPVEFAEIWQTLISI